MAIERKFVKQNVRELRIKEFIESEVSRVGLSDVKLKKTPLGDKIIISASRPGLVVGRGGSNIQSLTKALKAEFELENPQIEIEEITKPDLDADIVAERIINSLERFGSARTKSIGHRAITDVMNSGALGVEILISGKIPSMRARRWRFYSGYLKKSGDLAIEEVRRSIKSATLKSGMVGVQVRIMPAGVVLPDHITLTKQPVTEVSVEENSEDKKGKSKEKKSKDKPKDKDAKSESKSQDKPKQKPAQEVKKAASETQEDSGAEDAQGGESKK